MFPKLFCWHRWGKWAAPKTVRNIYGSGELAQKRICEKCAAADYRRVLIHN